MKKIEAKIIADSINTKGDRITSFVMTFPRIILAELNTHRALSRNSASSRAIPFERMLKMVEEDPFIPIRWMKDHSGMQGNEFFSSELCDNSKNETYTITSTLKNEWLTARNNAVKIARQMSILGLTKQIVNRLLEPFMWHTAIVTATEWQNFFALRANDAAEIHLQELAYKALEAMNENKPWVLLDNQWHIPFGDNMREGLSKNDKIKIATARCARVSYMNFEGKDDYEADFKLYDQLLKSGHMSPMEHCAKADSNAISISNFVGWTQLRKLIPNENKKDSRLKY